MDKLTDDDADFEVDPADEHAFEMFAAHGNKADALAAAEQAVVRWEQEGQAEHAAFFRRVVDVLKAYADDAGFKPMPKFTAEEIALWHRVTDMKHPENQPSQDEIDRWIAEHKGHI